MIASWCSVLEPQDSCCSEEITTKHSAGVLLEGLEHRKDDQATST